METAKKRILCYGDSLTWGYAPGSGERYDENTRWTGILRQRLSDFAEVSESGLNGRTTAFDDPIDPFRNGLTGLGYVLQAEKPLDLIIVFLGVNDLKFTDAVGSARALGEVMRTIRGANFIYGGTSTVFPDGPRALLIAPPPLYPGYDEIAEDMIFYGTEGESKRLAALYQPVAERFGAAFMDAGAVVSASRADGLHIDAENHERLAKAIETKVREIFRDGSACLH